jgi:osmotically-inducible protein OsmY
MRSQKSSVLIGAACGLFVAAGLQAQVGVDVEGATRAAGGVSQAGRGVGAAADAALDTTARVRGPTDADIALGVQTALTQELQIPGVRSDVRNGVATLSGSVASEAEKQRAERVVRRVDGVTRVRNDLVIAGAAHAGAAHSAARPAGAALDAAVASRIDSNANLAAREIVVKTRDDVVTLTGEVASAAEKETAGRLAADAAAGAEVRNRLKVRGDK